MVASSRSRLAASGIALLVLLTSLSYGRLRPGALEPSPAAGSTFLVTNQDDAGRGSLRQAILDANASANLTGPDRIAFAIPAAGVHVISLRTPLPAVTDPVVLDGFTQTGARRNALEWVRTTRATDAAVRIVIDGSRAGDGDGLVLLAGDSAVRGLAITGFSGSGVRIDGRGHNRIEGNVIGQAPGDAADVFGEGAEPAIASITAGNGRCGITIASSAANVVGGLEAASRNVIRANACAVAVIGAGAVGNAILGNSIESNADGIALVDGSVPVPTLYHASGLDSGPDSGPNRHQSAPALIDVARAQAAASDDPAATLTIVEGRLAAAPRTAFRIELFASDPPTAAAAVAPGARARREGARPLASQTVTTADEGGAAFRVEVPVLLPGGTWVTATATDPAGNTSEFSEPLVVPGVVVSWKNAVDGNWDDTANWNPAQVPGPADTADITIAGTYKVTIDVATTVGGFTLGGASGTQTLASPNQTFTVNGPGSVNANGVLEVLGGLVTGTGNLTVDGGTLSGSGTVTGTVDVSGTGALSPGTSTGLLSIVGDYTQSAPNGAYAVEIGGTTAGTQYDRADISGAGSVATLAGALNVSLINAFTPSSGDIFTIMTYPTHTGTFTPNLPSLPGGLVWNVAYNPTSVVLSVGGGAASGDLSITKTGSPDPVNAGGTVTYTLTIANTGPDAASDVSVEDTLPGNLTDVTGSGTGWTCPAPVAGVLTCTRTSLAVGAAPDITITGTVPGSGPLVNTATISSSTSDPSSANNTDIENTAVTPIADLSIVKTDSADPVGPNAQLTYTLTVSNAGPSSATSVSVVDTLPGNLTGASGSGTGWTCGAPASGAITCTRGGLASGGVGVITITGTAPAGGSLSNTAAVSSATSDPDSGNNSDTEGTTVSAGPLSADLSIVKTDSPDPVNAASNLTYTLTVDNAGPDAATSVTVTDTLPPTLSNVSGSGEGWSCDPPSSGVITCTRASLDVGSAPPITILGITPGEGPITNTAAVTSATPDPAPGNNSATASTTILRVADMSVQMTDSPDPVDPGGTLTYTVTLTNNGPSTVPTFTNANFHVPAALTNVTMDGDGWNCGSNNHGVFGCSRSNFAVGTAPPLIITATVPSAGLLQATVQVTSQTQDFNLSNNSATVQTTLSTSSDLSLVMTDSPDPVVGGGTLTYALAVNNHGPSNAITLSVADTLPAGLTNVVGSGSGWECPAPVSGVLTCTRSFLLPGDAPVLTITGTAPASGPLINSATVSSSTADPSSANNSDTETTTVGGGGQGVADLSILKADQIDPVEAGQTITWTIDVTNNGSAAASRVTVTDTLPVGISQPRASGAGWDCNESVSAVVCRRGSLPPGPAPPITLTARAPGVEGVVTNQADVTSDTTDLVLENNIASETTTVTPVNDMAVLKVHGPSRVKLTGAKDSSTERIKVQIQNRGPHDETITTTAMLGNLVRLTVESLGACSDAPIAVLTGSPQETLPHTLHPKQKMNVWFDVTFSTECVNDPAKTTATNPGHDDYQLLVSIDHEALDGEQDTHDEDDVCPRSVKPPFEVDRYPDGSIKDKGCGKQKGDRTFGDPVTIDVWVRP